MIKNKTMGNLGFINRTCGYFTDPYALKIFYCALVRSNIEYYFSYCIHFNIYHNYM